MDLVNLESNPPIGKYTTVCNEFTIEPTIVNEETVAVTETKISDMKIVNNDNNCNVAATATVAVAVAANDNDNADDVITTISSEVEMVETLKPGSKIKPNVTTIDAEHLLRRLYGITLASIKELISYDDRNYYVTEDSHVKNPIINHNCPHGYVLKIVNALDSNKMDFFDAQTELMLFLGKNDIVCPIPVANVYGKYFSLETFNGIQHIVRLLEFIPGKIFHEIEKTKHNYYECGKFIAKFARTCKAFEHEAFKNVDSIWHLKSVPKIKEFLYVLQDHGRKEIVEQVIEAFEKNVLTNINSFEKGIIHGDVNEQNIIVHKINNDNNNNDYKILGIIDFGDTSVSPYVFELAIAITYMILLSKDLSTGGVVIAGYNSIRLLDNKEKKILKECVAARMVQSLVMGAYTNSIDPQNEYVLTTQTVGWDILEKLWKENTIDEIWENAADEYLKQSLK